MKCSWKLKMKFTLLTLIFSCLVSCEEELLDPVLRAPDISNSDGYFVARAGDDRNILTGDTVKLKASYARNQRNNSFLWRIIEKPPNSLTEITNSEDPVISFKADQPGIYKLELGMFFEQFSSFDTVQISAFTISNLQGSYTDPVAGASGLIRQFLVFQDKLYAIGDFITIGGVEAYGFASYDGNRWTGLGADLLMDQVHQVIEFQSKLVISGSSREVGSEGVNKFVVWDEDSRQTLGFTETGSDMAVYKEVLFLNFGSRLGTWDGSVMTYQDIPQVESITYIKAVNDLLYLRGFSGELCLNSTEDMWVYHCEANGFLLQFDGFIWSEFGDSQGYGDCLNIGTINWDYHVWINSEPDFKWNIMAGYQDRVHFHCGYAENGTLKDFPYPFEKIYTMQVIGNHDLYLSGQNQKTGNYTGIMKWDGQQWYTLGDGVDGQIMTIQEYRGRLFIGGSFTRQQGQPQTNFTIWEDK